MTKKRWRVRLGAEAERDFAQVLRFTRENFGRRQAATYKMTLVDALAELGEGPNAPGSVSRDDILPYLRSLHVARGGRRGRHFIMYRAGPNDLIEIVRILHDAMDLARHVPGKSE